MTTGEAPESVEAFRARARAWLAETMPRLGTMSHVARYADEDGSWRRARELQQKLYAGGFAGIRFPKAYGGLGLGPAHQLAFNEESAGYELPILLNIPTFSVCCATLLDWGTEEQKREHIGAAIRGEEVLAQFLSEPSGGSDLAGLITRAERHGDEWVINGAKTWSTSAYGADYALCLARTDPSRPKHDGLTMFLMPTNAPGLTMNRIRMVDGSTEFCEEFFDDVRLPADAVVGEVNGGWKVVTRQLHHERSAMGGGSPYTSGEGMPRSKSAMEAIEVARAAGRTDDPEVRTLVGEALALALVHEQLVARVSEGLANGHLEGPAITMPRLFHAETSQAENDLGLRIAGALATVGSGPDPFARQVGTSFLNRQVISLGGGSTEMARNVISERLLGMPREHAPDRGVPFHRITRG
ncbi:acyl-CoA dehydrogenase family protein [Yinghuangia sp. ASG 101]|uniref:acyl-CoA dehydrogenase family protein n=1 Tax=Yinghuangia sp. ASG 101 TaxID=2896848 RepID=UPI001E5C5001|nr:acyl-CoA dehydrogenase family protein [Yinghuangia sp. ASG 101]UGQ12498.1 acyl-CoA dehydrogenase family protein [Yinghuangia sp. ASG 101]